MDLTDPPSLPCFYPSILSCASLFHCGLPCEQNERSLQETGFNTEDNEIPNVLEYEPIGRQEGETRNAGIPEYEVMPAKTQPADQPHSGVLATDQTGLYESADQQGGTENDSNPSSVTYQTIQPRTGDYGSLSPSTRLPPKGTSTGSPTRTGEYEALHHKGVSPQYQSLDDFKKTDVK